MVNGTEKLDKQNLVMMEDVDYNVPFLCDLRTLHHTTLQILLGILQSSILHWSGHCNHHWHHHTTICNDNHTPINIQQNKENDYITGVLGGPASYHTHL